LLGVAFPVALMVLIKVKDELAYVITNYSEFVVAKFPHAVIAINAMELSI